MLATGGCTTVAKLDNPRGLAVSPDGTSLYVATIFQDGITIFDRSASGTLTPDGCAEDSGGAGCVSQDGLNGAIDVTVSPDGASVYAVGSEDDALVRFDRVAGGALVARNCFATSGSAASCGAVSPGLDMPLAVVVSPDGHDVYVASGAAAGAVTRFRRQASGALAAEGCVGALATTGCDQTAPALGSAEDVTISSDGRSVYVPTTNVNDDAFLEFYREPSGVLRSDDCVDEGGSFATCGKSIIQLEDANGATVSPDGKHVYASAGFGFLAMNRDIPPTCKDTRSTGNPARSRPSR